MTVGGLLRQGAVTEIVGPLCSGRTSLLAACLGEVGRAGGGAALLVLARRRVLGAGATLAVETRRRGLAWAGPLLVPTRLAGVEPSVSVLRRQGAAALGDGVVWWRA